MYVQLSEDGSEVVAIFSAPQDQDVYPHQSEVDEKDKRVIAFKKKISENMK